MSIPRALCLAAVCTSVLVYGGAAWADEPAPAAPATAAAAGEGGEGGIRLPVSYVERGITNPEKILSPVADFGIGRLAGVPGIPFIIPASAAGALAGVGTPLVAQLTVGAGYAITDDLGVRATVIAMGFNPSVQYYGPSFGATYRFIKGNFEMGAALDIGLSTVSGAGGAVISPAVPMHLHIGKVARLDVTPGLFISTPLTTLVGLSIPVQFAYDIIEPLHVGAVTGYTMDFNAPRGGLTVGQSVAIPLGFIAGYAIKGDHGPMLDLDPFFVWPGLFTPGISGNAIGSGAYDFGIEATYYFYL